MIEKEKNLSFWHDHLNRDLDFLLDSVKKIEEKVSNKSQRHPPIKEDLERFSTFINQELFRYFPEKMGRKKRNIVVEEENEELKTAREVKRKAIDMRKEL